MRSSPRPSVFQILGISLMVSNGRAIFRLFLLIFWTLLLLPFQILLLVTGLPLSRSLPMAYHKGCLRILGITVTLRGRAPSGKGILYISNHSSYLDIPILGALIRGSFVSKAEVAAWPVFGLLSKLQGTVFVDRMAIRKTAHQRDSLLFQLKKGKNLILFPEGTSSDGNHILKFKSSLFSVAEGHLHNQPLKLVPVVVAYTRLDGLPMGRLMRPFYAWYGDMSLGPHMWQMMGMGRVGVDVIFHDPITIDSFAGRKELTAYCEGVIAQGLSKANSGRLGDLSEGPSKDENTIL